MYGTENGVIGSILQDPNCLYEIYADLKPEMFKSNFCRTVYSNALEMFDRGERIDIITLADKCTNGMSNADGFQRQMADCVIDTPTSALVKQYAESLIQTYKNEQFCELIRNVNSNPNDVDEQISKLICELENLQLNKKTTSQSLSEMVSMYQYDYFNGDKTEGLIKTGLTKLDECISLEGGDVTVIGARPSVGKSALANQIVLAAAKQGKKVGMFNLEMIQKQVYERFIANQSQLELARIRKGIKFLGDEQEKFFEGNKELAKLNVIVSAGAKTDQEIKAECRHQNFDLIVIDYLQLIKSSKRCESRRVEVGEISRSIKQLAMELNVPIILLSQLSRETEKTQNREPTMSDLRETGDIEQDASIIILLWNLSRNSELKDYKGLKVEKNRQGELMEENLIFTGSSMTFGENDKNTLDEVKEWIKSEEKTKGGNSDNPFV